MAINNFHFKLDIEREDYIPKFRLKQYDTAIFYVSLYKNGLPYHFENEQIKMFVKKLDGTIVYQEDNISIQDDEVKINVNNQALVCSGLTYAELEFKSSDGQVTSSTFLYEVKEKVGSDKAIESVTDIATLDKLKKYMEDAKKELEKFKNDFSKIEDLVTNKDKLEGQNEDAKKNIVELGKVLEDANNITSDEGKYITGNNVVSESTNGYIQDLKLYGRSLVNVTSGELPKQGSCAFESIIATELKRELKVTQAGSCVILRKGNFKKNTEYTIVADIKYVSSVNDLSFSFHDGITNSFTIDMKSVKKVNDSDYATYVVNLNTGNADVDAVVIGYHGSLPVDSVLGVTKVLGLEGDHTQPPSHFEGISSSGNCNQLEIMTRKEDGNLLDINNIDSVRGEKTWTIQGDKVYVNGITKDYETSIYYFIKVEKNKQYTVSVKDLNCGVLIYNGKVTGHDQSLHRGSITSNYRKVTFTSTSDYITIRISSEIYKGDLFADSIMVNLGDLKPYERIKKDKKTILFKDTDNNWKLVTNLPGYWENGKFIWGDTIEQHSDGKYYYHKRGYQFILNGSEAWGDNGTPRDGCSTFYIRGFSGISKFKILCDKFNYNISPMLSTVGISSQSNILYLTVKTDYASNVTELKNKLKIDNIRLVFEDIEKIYECLDISTRAFRNKTMLSIYSGAIDPGISYYVPTGFLSADNSISEKVETLDKYSEKNTKDINDLTSNIENNYFNINRRLLTDFNNGTQEGKYYLHSSSLIPNSPPTSTTGLYGIVEVLYKNENELFQFVTLHSGESWLRFRNGHGDWDKWHKLVTQDDFHSNIDSQGTGYQYLPNGMLMQWGTTTVTFDSVKGSAIIRYPVTYKAYCKCTGNLESNDYGSYSETNAVVGGQTLSQGFCEVRDINGSSRAGKIARVTWIVIGR